LLIMVPVLLLIGEITPKTLAIRKLGLPESTHTTLAGMLLERLHEVPLQGSVVQLDKLTFVIQRCSSQAIQEV
ncbi:MAG: hypothetical protein GWO21_04065, partial [Gammaproteobacteria bacterium]|nr:hypothetical protein [Gammaproteobacteria bacterium]